LGAVKESIIWRVKEGKVVDVAGQEEAQKLKDMLKNADANSVHIAELGVGAVARRGVLGEPDDKKMLGTGHIAIGDNRFGGGNIASDVHLDGVFLDMTLELDGKVVMKDGVLQI
jgi:leucyl aminopeptidase (aminopeptidase T)